jgi:predicted MPP superfamily phosphohydrolase
MKTVCIGDIHGRRLWKEIIEQENPDKVIFIGDYFDSFDIDAATQINNFLDICEYARSSGKRVILLIGNHDYYYFPEIDSSEISGYNHNAAKMINHVLAANRNLLQMAHNIEDVLFTHAGVSTQWLDDKYPEWRENGETAEGIALTVNNLWKHKPLSFMFYGFEPSGNNTYQTPIWIRPQSLMRANRDTLKEKVIQVVGHTQMKEIDIEGKATGGRYYFIDTLSVKQYLIIEDGKFKLGKIEKSRGDKE